MIITISGSPGSGKSTVAEKLAKKLRYRRHYAGAMQREIAKKKGLTLEESSRINEKDFTVDKLVDEVFKKMNRDKKADKIIAEGRTAFYFIPRSLKIFIHVDPKEGAKRIFNGLKKQKDRNEDKNLTSVAAVLKSLKRRLKSEGIRYQKYYKLNIWQKKHYDLWLDATKLDKKQEFDAIWQFVKSRLDT